MEIVSGVHTKVKFEYKLCRNRMKIWQNTVGSKYKINSVTRLIFFMEKSKIHLAVNKYGVKQVPLHSIRKYYTFIEL